MTTSAINQQTEPTHSSAYYIDEYIKYPNKIAYDFQSKNFSECFKNIKSRKFFKNKNEMTALFTDVICPAFDSKRRFFSLGNHCVEPYGISHRLRNKIIDLVVPNGQHISDLFKNRLMKTILFDTEQVFGKLNCGKLKYRATYSAMCNWVDKYLFLITDILDLECDVDMDEIKSVNRICIVGSMKLNCKSLYHMYNPTNVAFIYYCVRSYDKKKDGLVNMLRNFVARKYDPTTEWGKRFIMNEIEWAFED
tara:strand:+ start:31 stop:780 length:750 start_codon:yes stop_codon:yes gene_type:complete